MNAFAWMADQVASIPSKPPAPEQKPRKGTPRIVDLPDLIEYAKSRGLHLTVENVRQQFGVNRSTARLRLLEGTSLGLLRRHQVGYRKRDVFEVIG